MKSAILGSILAWFSILSVECWIPRTFNGRPAEGFIRQPPETIGIKYPDEQFYEFQYVNHFDGSDFRTWKQRYFVNDTFQTATDGPLFLVLGGEAELDPIWAVEGAWIQYAQQHGAVLVLLEHRYYGKSYPVKDLSTDNLQYLSSRQAIADAAQFLADYKKYQQNIADIDVIVFGASYSGSLALWFRSKYPTMVNGAVASSPHLLASMDFIEYFVTVTNILDRTAPGCVGEIRNATNTMYDWWGQQDKRVLMQDMFRLCDKIDHELPMDLSVLFYNLAENFGDVVQYNKDNRAFMGGLGSNVTIDTLCDIMTDERRGGSVQRYADVNSLLLDAYKESCLNIRYTELVQSLNYTELDNATENKGGRQWLYQMCSELGWIHTSSSPKQPFGQYFFFPYNFTTDQCTDLFYEGNSKGVFGGDQVIDNCIGTNRYYGGRNMPLSYAILVNHELDPWRNMTGPQNLPYSQHTDVLEVKGTAHVADIYPPSDQDPPELTQARETISQTIGKWLAGST